MAATEETTTYVGSPVLRREDAKLVTGHGTYVDNYQAAGLLHATIVRSPYAHARITRVDVSKAAAAPGVVAAFSGEDLKDSYGALPCFWPVSDDIVMPPHLPLAVDKARYVGDGVAVVVAESRAQAKDAAGLVEVDYEPLPAVTDVLAALEDGAPQLHDEAPGNRCYTWSLATGEPDSVFSSSPVVVKERYRQQRLIPVAMEPRGVVCELSPLTGEVTVITSTQAPHIMRTAYALVMGIPEAKIRVIAPDVGGGFGSKVEVYADDMVVIACAKRLGRSVKWTEERSEACLATIHGRDLIQDIELAATEEGKIRGVRVRLTAAMGAYLQAVTPGVPLLGAWLYCGVYDMEAYDFHCTGVFTNTTPTDAYRGAGRPEATYAIERAVDALARRVGKSPVEIRRLNFLRGPFPRAIVSGLEVDAADLDAALDRGLEMLDLDAFRQEQESRRAQGSTKLLGVGFSTYMEMCGLAPSRILGALKYGGGGWESMVVRHLPTGTVQVVSGTSPHGQGHATTFSQIVADQLGCDIADIEFLHGDTAVSPQGWDTYGSRSLPVGGVALVHACQKIVEKGRQIAAHQLEVSPDDLEFAGGQYTVRGTDRSMPLKGCAFEAWHAHNLPDGMEPGLEASHQYDPPNFSWPSGCHIAVVEVDTETGNADLVRYIAVDDVGNVINPMVVEGQVHGGIAQGVAQALWEEAVYDADGNLVTGSLTNYLVPSAAELPSYELDRTVTPSPTNPLGVKGVGETGTIASTPAVVNAIVDALAHLGVTDLDMPASPERVWQAISSPPPTPDRRHHHGGAA
jgi:carbon-monoxide dehydrogenase large subunit